MADLATSPPLTRASVQAARELIAPYVHHTPTLTNRTLTRVASTPRTRAELARAGGGWDKVETPASPKLRLWFKCENLQRVGAFKARGAFHALGRLLGEEGFERGRGVVTHSSGEWFFFSSSFFSLSVACRECFYGSRGWMEG